MHNITSYLEESRNSWFDNRNNSDQGKTDQTKTDYGRTNLRSPLEDKIFAITKDPRDM